MGAWSSPKRLRGLGLASPGVKPGRSVCCLCVPPTDHWALGFMVQPMTETPKGQAGIHAPPGPAGIQAPGVWVVQGLG